MNEIMIPITLFICIAAVLFGFFYYSAKAKAEQQKTLQQLIENGQTLSPELVASIAKPNPSNNTAKDFSRGVLLISLSVAILFYGWVALAGELEFIGLAAFPFAIGFAFLLIQKFKPKSEQ